MTSDLKNESGKSVGQQGNAFDGTVVRSLLDERFFNNLNRKLTLIEAPAGYGKTTLMQQWFSQAQQANHAAIWVQVGAESVQSLAIEENLVLALAPLIGGQSEQTTAVKIEGTATLASILGLMASIEERILLFFDDVHDCTPAESELIHRLMLQSGDNVHIVIGTRETLGIPLTKLRLDRKITDFGVEDLRLSRAEVAALFSNTATDSTIDSFLEYSEGWIAALQLMRQANETTRPLDLDLRKGLGGQEGIAQYLNEHFFDQLSSSQQAFLIDTSHLNTIDGDLADYIRQDTGSWDMLANLAGTHSLVFEVPGPTPGFRYHQLLRDFLLKRQATLGENVVRTLNLRAADWCFEHAGLTSAVRHALAALAPAKAVEMILQAGGVRIGMTHGAPRLAACLDQIPIRLIHQSPRLLIARGYLMLKQGRLNEAVLYLDEARQTIDASDEEAHRELVMVEAHQRLYEDRHLTTQQLAALEYTAKQTPVADTIMRGLFANFLCVFHIQAGNLDKAREFGEAAMAITTDLKVVHLQFFMHLHLSSIELDRGNYAAALEGRQRALDLWQKNFRHDLAMRALSDIYSCEISYESGDTTGVEQTLASALEQSSKAEGWSEAYLSGYETCLNVSFADRGYDAAIGHIAEAEATVARRSSRRFARHLRILELELALDAQNEPEIERLTSQLRSILKTRQAEDRLRWRGSILARLALARSDARMGSTDQALVLLDEVVHECHPLKLNRFRMRAGVLQVIIAAQAENWAIADQSLRLTLSLAQTDFPGAFIRHAEAFSQAARDCVHNNGLAAYSRDETRKLAKILWACAGHDPKDTHTLLEEMLTAREFGVLELIARGDANKVIARKLDLSEATVKFHVKNIFVKLGVNSRKLAAEIAVSHGVATA